jgi:phage terminase small subunit
MTLTPKQQRFVEEYLIDLNATQAAIRSGYSEKTADKQGSQLLGKTGIAAAIASAQAKRSQRTEITVDYVLSSIFETMQRCKQAEAVTDRQGQAVLVETPDGDMVPAYTFNATGVLKGAELLGKHLGMFSDKDAGLTGADAVAAALRDVADRLNG